MIERLFVVERRRLKIIPKRSAKAEKLVFGALVDTAELWKSIKVTEFA